MKKHLRRIGFMAVAMLLGAGAGAVTTSSAVAEAGVQGQPCYSDHRCDGFSNQCESAIFDTWCEVVAEDWCNTWTTGECWIDD